MSEEQEAYREAMVERGMEGFKPLTFAKWQEWNALFEKITAAHQEKNDGTAQT